MTKAPCSSDGTLRTAAVECRGSSKSDLKLQLALNESTVSCEAEGTSTKNMVYLATRCEDWVDLDDECSAVKQDKINAGDRCVCYHQGYATCSIWPSMTCTVSVGEVTMMSVGQDDPKCVHYIEAAATTATTTTTTTATSSSTSSAAITTVPNSLDTRDCASESTLSDCEIDAIIDIQGFCTGNDDHIDFDEWLTCYKAVQDCGEVTRSICGMKHCCLNDFIRDVECHTGCEVDCDSSEETVGETNIERSSMSVYLPEVCLNLWIILSLDDIDVSDEDYNSASFVHHTLALGITLVTSLLA